MPRLSPALLPRDLFREQVFARDRRRCVICGAPAQDAHHILERRLWDDGGYYLDNGASVCAEHHLACERTLISVEEVRRACGIQKPLLPPHLYDDDIYDKWGNQVLANGMRLRGELFFDPSVQKVLSDGGVLDLFSDRVKYPRTPHVPWSHIPKDDLPITSLAAMQGQRVVVLRKMDGEQTSLYHDGTHARSLDGRSHPSRDWVKNFWSSFAADIPPHWRVCGENLFAQHSIAYTNLPSYFMGFSVWNERNECLGWDETLEWFDLLGITPVPTLYDGIFDETLIRGLYDDVRDWEQHEGYVVRLADSFPYRAFRLSVAKYVRPRHVQTIKHWAHGPIIPNQLAADK